MPLQEQTMRKLIWFRRSTQLLVVIVFCLLPWLNLQGWHNVSGTLFAFDLAGVPFADPASAAQAAVLGGHAGSWPIISYYIGGLLTLIIAFLLGRIFCGWFCPYGFLSELVHSLRGASNSAETRKKANLLFGCKIALLLLCLLLAMLFGYPLISLVSMPGELSLVPLLASLGAGWALLLTAIILPLAMLLAELISGRRLWCQYVCPQSVFLGLAAGCLPPKCAGLAIGWDAGDCTCGKQSPCQAVCGMGLNPRHKNGPLRRDCLMCGDCVQTCQAYGKALKFMIR